MMNVLTFLSAILIVQVVQGCFYGDESGPSEQLAPLYSTASITVITDNETSLIWTHMDTETVVGRSNDGEFLLLGDSVFYTTDVKKEMVSGENRISYKLHLNASRVTEGVYRVFRSCAKVNGTSYFVVALNATSPKSGTTGMKDYTGCCNSSVSASCLPVCRPASLNFLTFKFESCSSNADVSGFRKCLLRSRNHVRCCTKRGVTGDCLHLCYDSTAAVNASVCPLREVVQCYYEGQEDIPSPPRNIFVETKSRTSVIVHWNIPMENFAYLTEYQVLHKLVDATHFRSEFVSSTTLSRKITIEMDKRYVVKVRACGPHGCSYPSESMTISTVTEYFYPDVGNESSVSSCCEKEGVSKSCQLQFCVGIPRQISLSQLFLCIKDWPRIVKCFAGGRNHTPCCLENGVEPKCAKYCSGEVVDTKLAEMACMTNFRVMGSCFDAGVRTVPSQPRMLRTDLVLSTSIKLQWDSPQRVGNPKTGLGYSVLYRNLSAGEIDFRKLPAITERTITIGNLSEGAVYDISVVAFNTHGTSLMSSILRVTTHSVAPVTYGESPKYDPKQCCISKGLSPVCVSNACDLTETTASASIPEECKPKVLDIAHCLADSRNHSYCCQKDSRIHRNCRFLCTLDVRGTNSSVSADVVWSCLQTSSVNGLRSCYASGHGLLPSPPRNLRLFAYHEESAKIGFDVPTSHADVTGYWVYITSDGKLFNIQKENSLTHSVSISELKANKNYEIRVTAVTKKGYESLPSNAISFRTLPHLPSTWYQNRKLNFNSDNITTCCSKSGISSTCQILCDPSNTTTLSWTPDLARTCITDLGKIVGCAVDKRDHRPCCLTRRVPHFCLPICEGNVDASITNSAVCIQFFPEIRSCFLEGYEILPETPQIEEIRPLSHSSVYIKFSSPKNNSALPGKVYYYIYYKNSDFYWHVKAKVSSPYILSRLRTSSTYSIFIIAVSDNGTSLPSALYNVTTFQNSPFQVSIVVSPGLLVKQYDAVKMTCRTDLTVPTSYAWYHEGILRPSSGGVLEMNVTRDDVGLYACVTKAMNKSVTRDVYLKVQYLIQVIALQPLVRTGLYVSVTLGCTFTGFPETVAWIDSKGNEILPMSEMFAVTTKSNQHFTESELVIVRMTEELYGKYQCAGKNYHGESSAMINVVDTSFVGVIPTIPSPTTTKDPKSCCDSAGVSRRCRPGCDFNVRAEFFQSTLDCIYEFGRIYQCLTDRRNHTQCCQRRNVPDYCWPVCSGLVPSLDRRTITCFNPTYAQLTLQCMKEGTDEIPTAPQLVKASDQTRSSMLITWRPPKENAEYVTSYQIRVRDLDMETDDYKLFEAEKNVSFVITDLPDGHTFLVSVRARSLYGDSQYSTAYRSFTIGVPKPPVNLHIQLIGGVSMKLSWEMPQFSAVKATNYAVYWGTKEMEEEGTLNKNATEMRELVLPCLKPETTYKFQVVAKNEVGMSAKSQEEIQKTEKNSNPHCTKRKKTVVKYKNDNSHFAAILILLSLLVVGLGLTALFVYTNRNNPRYAWPGWIRRLPGMQPARRSQRDFDNPIRFSNLAHNGMEDDEGRVAFGGQEQRHRGFSSLSTDA